MNEEARTVGTAKRSDATAIPIPEMFRRPEAQEDADADLGWTMVLVTDHTAAGELCARLERVGIPANMRPLEDAATQGLPQAEVLVPKEHLVAAREALARPQSSESDDDEEEDDDDQYYIDRSICPECRVGELEPKRMARPWRCVGWLWMAMITLQLVMLFFPEAKSFHDLLREWQLAYLGVVAALAVAFAFKTGNKQCPRCGWELIAGKRR